MRIGLAGAGRIGARHAAALCQLPEVESLVIADADAARARKLAAGLGGLATAVEPVADLFTAGLDGLVVAAATEAHPGLVSAAVAGAIPVFCEKPLAPDASGTFQIAAAARAARVPVQVGFQRRFDAGYVAAREAVTAGTLGWIHTIRSCTLDPAPPPAAYIPGSGGLFRDCVIHDLDSIRYVTGREIVRVVAAGANRGDEIFRECGDIDTGAALLVLDDGTLGLVSATRYNAAGYDVRLELFGSKDSLAAGLDPRTPVTPVPSRIAPERAYEGFLDRFADAYDAELRAFLEVVAGERANPCPPEEALEAFYLAEACTRSHQEGRPVDPAEVRR